MKSHIVLLREAFEELRANGFNASPKLCTLPNEDSVEKYALIDEDASDAICCFRDPSGKLTFNPSSEDVEREVRGLVKEFLSKHPDIATVDIDTEGPIVAFFVIAFAKAFALSVMPLSNMNALHHAAFSLRVNLAYIGSEFDAVSIKNVLNLVELPEYGCHEYKYSESQSTSATIEMLNYLVECIGYALENDEDPNLDLSRLNRDVVVEFLKNAEMYFQLASTIERDVRPELIYSSELQADTGYDLYAHLVAILAILGNDCFDVIYPEKNSIEVFNTLMPLMDYCAIADYQGINFDEQLDVYCGVTGEDAKFVVETLEKHMGAGFEFTVENDIGSEYVINIKLK